MGNNLQHNLNISNLSDREAFGENKLIGQVRNLERFCNEVLSNKLFWTPEILNFFQVPTGLLPQFEAERE